MTFPAILIERVLADARALGDERLRADAQLFERCARNAGVDGARATRLVLRVLEGQVVIADLERRAKEDEADALEEEIGFAHDALMEAAMRDDAAYRAALAQLRELESASLVNILERSSGTERLDLDAARRRSKEIDDLLQNADPPGGDGPAAGRR